MYRDPDATVDLDGPQTWKLGIRCSRLLKDGWENLERSRRNRELFRTVFLAVSICSDPKWESNQTEKLSFRLLFYYSIV